MLTEIHRQARDNPIIGMSMNIRDGKPLQYGDYGDSHIVSSRQCMLEATADIDVDQFIVGRNTTRQYVNRREMDHEWSVGPMPGDRLVCLRNNHQKGLLNGEQFTLQRVDKTSNDGFMTLWVKSDDRDECDQVETHQQFFKCAKVEEARARVGKYGIDEFAYGYALTAHKAQGSQWNHVVVSDESRRFEAPQRWLYTAITRAKESVTIITGYG
jgi:exodeoxyribonuclease-5